MAPRPNPQPQTSLEKVQIVLTQLDNSALIRFLLLLASGWALLQVLDYFEIVVVIFVISTILAFLLSYPVTWCRRFLPRSLAVFTVFMVALVLVGGIVTTLALAVIAQGQSLLDNGTDFLNSLQPLIESIETTLRQWNVQVDLQTLGEQLQQQATTLLGSGLGLVQTLLENFINGILIAVVTFFMMLDGPRLWRLFLKAIPEHQQQPLTLTIQKNLLGFFWGRLLLSIFFAISTFAVFLLLQIPYALVLAVIAGLFDLIPGIGATLGVGLIGLLLLSQGIGTAIQSVVVCILLQQVEENILLPHVMRDSLNINPVVMFFALIVGVRVAGLLGLFLAIPIAGVIVSLLDVDEMKGRAL
ncbi:AI-2E family transporter [Leptolyngbya cf. ectocarpi LEGE 11479]|uniref:AI-2E family transporter n=1 Tax=Leptolyngbya cf. ectocarpi LEGE 11479 TaxID=1828722 RepID=A0A928ZSP7_LEPEC|nr:AI-2E family transporter [Leptolyngbya ectocarpi]MBE9066597.1 AI-2E family transporter [Leptolyngbya cf. ectocarpi LEGE 11479]